MRPALGQHLAIVLNFFCVCLLKGDVCRVQVISQCRRAEVYQGRLREYSSTVNASFVDSSEDEEGDDAMSSMIIGQVISIGVSALIAVIRKLFLRQEVPLRWKKGHYVKYTANWLKFSKNSSFNDHTVSSVFKLDIDLRNEKNSCSQVQLKLTGLANICWLMGVFVSLQETSSSKPTAFMGSHFDLDQVNQMLDSKKLSQR